MRGEGEHTFRTLVRTLEEGGDLACIPGLSHRRDGVLVHNPDRPVARLAHEPLALPKRAARVLTGYTLLGRPVDVVETSRGCTFDCSFCSIIEMRGRNFHPYAIDRVLDDIVDARRHGARAIFLVDDNITKLEAVWRRAAAAGYDHVLLADSKFTRLGELDERYRRNIERVRKLTFEMVDAIPKKATCSCQTAMTNALF